MEEQRRRWAEATKDLDWESVRRKPKSMLTISDLMDGIAKQVAREPLIAARIAARLEDGETVEDAFRGVAGLWFPWALLDAAYDMVVEEAAENPRSKRWSTYVDEVVSFLKEHPGRLWPDWRSRSKLFKFHKESTPRLTKMGREVMGG